MTGLKILTILSSVSVLQFVFILQFSQVHTSPISLRNELEDVYPDGVVIGRADVTPPVVVTTKVTRKPVTTTANTTLTPLQAIVAIPGYIRKQVAGSFSSFTDYVKTLPGYHGLLNTVNRVKGQEPVSQVNNAGGGKTKFETTEAEPIIEPETTILITTQAEDEDEDSELA